jgi:hypothetical protein
MHAAGRRSRACSQAKPSHSIINIPFYRARAGGKSEVTTNKYSRTVRNRWWYRYVWWYDSLSQLYYVYLEGPAKYIF